jgi:rhodanese-related sulfurtransferase
MTLIRTLFLSALFMAAAWPAQARMAYAVSADAAHDALARGAFVVDVRSAAAFEQGHLPQAAQLDRDIAQMATPDLAAALSQAGVDTSRTVLVVGEAGDANAQALVSRLVQVSAGRVLWLVGGVAEWQMRGYALSKDRAVRAPVPQFFAPIDAPAQSVRMAGSKMRSTALFDRASETQWAFKP